MYILGISNGHVATATLLKDGKIIACASEERFNNIKSYNGFPKHAILWCLRHADIQGKDLDLVTTPYLCRPPIHAATEEIQSSFSLKLLVVASKIVGIARAYFRKLRFRFPQLFRVPGMILYRIAAVSIGAHYTYKQRQYIADFLGISNEKVVSFDHHLCHAASAYYASPLNNTKALVLTLDAEGDNYCSSANIFNGATFKILAKTPREYSLGYIFSWVTYFLGMKPHEHEYKVMGLAPYAKSEDVERVYKKIRNVIELDKKNPLTFSMSINAQDFIYYLQKYCRLIRFDHMCGAFQKLVEEKTMAWVRAAIQKTGISSVILSGGVFMNVKANERIAHMPEVKQMFVLPSCADESASIGSCYLGYRKMMMDAHAPLNIEPISDVYWGSSIEVNELLALVKKMERTTKYKVTKLTNPAKTLGKMLSEHKVVARMAGRMEFGARALGNRSILAHPQDVNIIREINTKMKNRDFWMPFAPTILEERQKDYLVNPKNFPAPYMILSFHSTPLAQKELAAALHPYDFTLRPQLLTRDMNPRYYEIIKEFERITGIGGVLNTSFNLHGYPIVRGVKEAYEAFIHSGLQYLVIEDYLIEKQA